MNVVILKKAVKKLFMLLCMYVNNLINTCSTQSHPLCSKFYIFKEL